MNKHIKKWMDDIHNVFTTYFGETSYTARVDDILKQIYALKSQSTISNLKQKMGNALCSLLELYNESGFDPEDLTNKTLNYIIENGEQYKRLGSKYCVAIYGGSFNPIHNGHIAFANYLLSNTQKFHEVWLMPCNDNLDKNNLISAEHRLAMCKLAVKNNPHIKIFDYEITNNLISDTQNTINHLLSSPLIHKYDFYFAIGQDVADSTHQWVNFEKLKGRIPFAVISRKGYVNSNQNSWYTKFPNLYYISETEIPELSSTLIRSLIKQQKFDDLKKIIPENVLEYITQHKLYT